MVSEAVKHYRLDSTHPSGLPKRRQPSSMFKAADKFLWIPFLAQWLEEGSLDFVTKHHNLCIEEEVHGKASVCEKVEKFVQEARQTFQNYTPLQVYNMDQKRVVYEKNIDQAGVITGSVAGITHSYTVLPMLLGDGMLHPKFNVVFA
uniref:Uncharacterized protein n=1 Tax=Caenorhabditis japonica TaxID=281687 RepID=A0A8R1E752_CAEJA